MLRPIMQGYRTKSRKANLSRAARSLAKDRPALDRIAAATGSTVNSVRTWTRCNVIPKNPNTARLFLEAVAAEVGDEQVRADVK